MRDASHGRQVRPCSRSRRRRSGSRRGQDAHHDSMDTRDARWPPRRPGRPSGKHGRHPDSGPFRRALRTTSLRGRPARGLLTGSAPGNVMYTLTVPIMDKPPSRYDVTVRVAKDDGHSPDPATFAAAASTAHRDGAPASSARTRPRTSSAWSTWPRQAGPRRLPWPWRRRPRAQGRGSGPVTSR